MRSCLYTSRIYQYQCVAGLGESLRDDPSQPVKVVYGVGQVYEVKISKVIKGNETGTIYLVQPEGFLGSTEMKNEVTILEIKKTIRLYPHPTWERIPHVSPPSDQLP